MLNRDASGRASLSGSLEDQPDPWDCLRAAWDEIAPEEILLVTYGSSGRFRLQTKDVANLLRLTGFRPLRAERVGKTRQMSAQKLPRSQTPMSCTVVVPCRNEVDNIKPLVERLPQIGTHTELIFVDGTSTDGTPERIEQVIREEPGKDIKLLRQAGESGKAEASFQGLLAASGDVAMILDADMTVRPEDLPRFYLALAEGVADVANGTRMVYPMESNAMPEANRVGNRLFGIYMTWLLGRRVTDTLCGTKAFLRRDIPRIIETRPIFGGHDPWGDFDMLMGAAYLGLRIVDVPIRYLSRTAGESKMRPLRHGVELARTCLVGTLRLKGRSILPVPTRG